jgi:cytochrome c oxidase subunit 4
MFRVIPLRAANRSLIRFTALNNQVANAHAAAAPPAAAGHHHVEFDRKNVYPRIGNREIVGFGRNGEPSYHDAADTPFPAIRWREDTAELKKLREKARGDWGNLTLDEKRTLYRADFRATISETAHQTDGEWKFYLGFVLALMGGSIWAYFFLRKLIYNYPRKETNSPEHQVKMLERMIGMGVGRVHGVSSEWDYEKGDWKSNTKQ